MPKFKIVEEVTETREVEAESAQEALDGYLAGTLKADPSIEIGERWVEDEHDEVCETEEEQ